MSDIRSLEHPTLKVPYENLNKRFRSAQKVIDREVSHVNSAIADVEKAIKAGAPDDVARIPALLDSVLERVNQLEAKTKAAVQEEETAAISLKRRVDHLR